MHTILVIAGVIVAIIVIVLVMKLLNWLGDKWFHLQLFAWGAKQGLAVAIVLVIAVVFIIAMISK